MTEEELAKRRKEWEFRAVFRHDVDLPRGTWAVDGSLQEAPLTEETLRAAVLSKGAAKPLVTVAAPLHVLIYPVVGFQPPYRHVMDAREAA